MMELADTPVCIDHFRRNGVLTRRISLGPASKLSGPGLGHVDPHLRAAAALAPETSIWTRDKWARLGEGLQVFEHLGDPWNRLQFTAEIRD